MKRYIAVLILLPSLCFGQYWGERATEKSFESSAMYFESQFLNPYGLHRFGDAAVGLIDDPFLALQLNPANIPRIQPGDYLLYLDFRGDRDEVDVIDHYYGVPYDYFGYRPTPRWYSTTREEPAPILSLGFLSYPFGPKADNVFIGGTYQVIHRQEKFYTPPSMIYKYRFGYDAFGESDDVAFDVPIQNRYSGKDELLTQAHIATVMGGWSISNRTALGLAINRTTHSRDGGYISSQADEYGDTNDRDYGYYREQGRSQQYDHYDMMAGLRRNFNSNSSGGLTLGYLSGDADQTYLVMDSSSYRYGTEGQDSRWSRSLGRSRTNQAWSRDGRTWYGGIQLEREFKRGRILRAHYRYSRNRIDLSNHSTIRDTSNYSSQYTYNSNISRYLSVSQTIDNRTGTGERKRGTHQGMVSMQWDLDQGSRIYAGLYFSRQRTELSSREPVIAERWSDYQREVNDTVVSTSYRRTYEEKTLVWDMESVYWTVQIPVFLRLKLNDYINATLGVNRIMESWSTKDQTTAYFAVRDVSGSDPVVNFGERYTQPDDKKTEDYTEIISSIEVEVSPEFSVRLMVNPDFEHDFRIAQWWLSFEVRP
jgi:hypothetical protein